MPDYYYNSQATNAFYKTNISQINLFVPQASKEFYKSQSPWSGFKSIRSIGAHFLTLGSYGNGKIKYMDKEVNYLYETIDVEPDEEVILELIPDEGHSVITIKVNDEEIMEPTTKYTINKLKEDTKIVAWFSPNWYKLTYMIDGEVYKKNSILINDIYVDGSRIGDVGVSIIKDRKIMSTDGILVAILNLDIENKKMIIERGELMNFIHQFPSQ